MSKHFRDVALRLRAHSLATPGILEFADVLAVEGATPTLLTAANALTDRDRAQVVAFLIEIRHACLDAGESDAAEAIAELIGMLAHRRWEELA
jgi:hypothetical protein